MAVVNHTTFVTRQIIPPQTKPSHFSTAVTFNANSVRLNVKSNGRRNSLTVTAALDGSNSGNKNNNIGVSVPNANYAVPLDISPSCITRPLAEILRDLNKRIPDNIIVNTTNSAFIPWYHANRMLSFYAPGWCGEIRDVILDIKSVTVVYRVTVRGSDGEAYRESTGTVSATNGENVDPVAAAEEIAFGKACARFGLGLYLYHEE